MAIWQFELSMLPKRALLARFNDLPRELPSDFSDGTCWSAQQPPADYAAVIDSFTSRYPSWSDEILMWGKENGDRVHVHVREGQVDCIVCRLDLRTFSPAFARGILRLATFCECVLCSRSERLFEPEWPLLIEAITDSDSMRFVSDPQGFITALSRPPESTD